MAEPHEVQRIVIGNLIAGQFDLVKSCLETKGHVLSVHDCDELVSQITCKVKFKSNSDKHRMIGLVGAHMLKIAKYNLEATCSQRKVRNVVTLSIDPADAAEIVSVLPTSKVKAHVLHQLVDQCCSSIGNFWKWSDGTLSSEWNVVNAILERVAFSTPVYARVLAKVWRFLSHYPLWYESQVMAGRTDVERLLPTYLFPKLQQWFTEHIKVMQRANGNDAKVDTKIIDTTQSDAAVPQRVEKSNAVSDSGRKLDFLSWVQSLEHDIASVTKHDQQL